MTETQSGQAENTLVVVVHGIGEQTLGSSMGAFAQGLTEAGVAAPASETNIRPLTDGEECFNYAYCDTAIAGKPVQMAEFYWANLSNIQSGMFAALRNFWKLITEIPDIAYSALGPKLDGDGDKDFLVLRVLRSLIALSLWVIYVPVVAMNVALFLITLGVRMLLWFDPVLHDARAQLSGRALVEGGTQSPDLAANATANWAHTVWDYLTAVDQVGRVNSAFAVAFGVLMLAAYLLRKSQYACWVLGFAAGFLVLGRLTASALLTGFGSKYPGIEPGSLLAYPSGMGNIFRVMWLAPFIVEVIFLASIPILLIFFWRRWRGIALAFAVYHLVVRFWFLLIVLVWLALLDLVMDQSIYTLLSGYIGLAFGPAVFAVIDVMAVVVIIMLAYMGNSGKAKAHFSGSPSSRYDRLIVPAWLIVFATVSGLAWALFLAEYNAENQGVTENVLSTPGLFPDVRLVEWITPINMSFVLLAPLLITIGGYFVTVANRGFDAIGDIVNFFRTDMAAHTRNPVTAMWRAFIYRPRRDGVFRPRLFARLEHVLADIEKRSGRPHRFVFVAHSLGTMIIIDALKKWRASGTGPAHVDVVTMGSPYQEIFNFYFPHMFPLLESADQLGAHSFTNIYRLNDYVGTKVSDDAPGISNIHQPPKGHLGYFSDPSVIREIVPRIWPRSGGG